MKRGEKKTNLTFKEKEKIKIDFIENAKKMLSELKFKELIELYQDDEPFGNDAEHLIWVLTEKEIEKRNPQWLAENEIRR